MQIKVNLFFIFGGDEWEHFEFDWQVEENRRYSIVGVVGTSGILKPLAASLICGRAYPSEIILLFQRRIYGPWKGILTTVFLAGQSSAIGYITANETLRVALFKCINTGPLADISILHLF